MKKLLLSVFILISALAKAQDTLPTLDSLPQVDGKVFYQSIVDVPNKNQNFIFAAAQKWVFDYYGGVSSFIEAQDQGQLIGQRNFSVDPVIGWFVNGNSYKYQYKIEIDCKDNKFRVQLYDMTYTIGDDTPNNPTYPLEDYNATIKKTKNKPPHQIAYEIDSHLRAVMQALSDAVTKAAHDDF